MAGYVLDTWPCQLTISRMNQGEVFYSIAKDHGVSAAKGLVSQFSLMSISVISVGDDDVDSAARLKAKDPISYADAFAAALSISRGEPLVTGDPEFKRLAADGSLTLEWVGA